MARCSSNRPRTADLHPSSRDPPRQNRHSNCRRSLGPVAAAPVSYELFGSAFEPAFRWSIADERVGLNYQVVEYATETP